MSVRLASSRKHHSSLIRLRAERTKVVTACRTSFKAFLVLFLKLDEDDDDAGVARVSERDRENNLGVEIGKREGNVG